jgi:hypothetical protein
MGEIMKEPGRLAMLPSGRWGIFYPGETPDEITSGDQFYIEVPGSGAMTLTRMEHGRIHGRGQYYSVDNCLLREGLRALLLGRSLGS